MTDYCPLCGDTATTGPVCPTCGWPNGMDPDR